jgi:hypothetical protein
MSDVFRKSDSSILDILPRDANRQAVLKTLHREKRPLHAGQLRSRVHHWSPEITLDAETASDVVQSAIREGLVDLTGQGADTHLKLTPFGEGIAKNLD